MSKGGSEGTDDRVQRVRVEAERTGWAKLYDLVRDFDKNRIVDNKEDIDTLLVFVSLVIPYTPQALRLTGNRLVYSPRLSPLSL